APYSRRANPGARRQTLCDTDRNGAGTRDRLTRDHRSAAARFSTGSNSLPRSKRSTHFCQDYRGLGRAVTSRLMRLLKSHIAALLRELATGSKATDTTSRRRQLRFFIKMPAGLS